MEIDAAGIAKCRNLSPPLAFCWIQVPAGKTVGVRVPPFALRFSAVMTFSGTLVSPKVPAGVMATGDLRPGH